MSESDSAAQKLYAIIDQLKAQENKLSEPPTNGIEPQRNATSLNIQEMDALLGLIPPEVEPATPTETQANPVLQEIDTLIGNVDQAIEQATHEIQEWDIARKRLEAARTSDEFTLNVLAEDMNPNVRALVCCNPHTNPSLLSRLTDTGNPYTQMLIANNPASPPELLDRLATTGVKEVMQAVARHPNASPVTVFKIEGHVPQPTQETQYNFTPTSSGSAQYEEDEY